MKINYIEMLELNFKKRTYNYDASKLELAFKDYKNICLNDEGKHREIKKEQIIDICNKYDLTVDEFNTFDAIGHFNYHRYNYAVKNGFSHQ